jgi:SAM-dependent methyltransferase
MLCTWRPLWAAVIIGLDMNEPRVHNANQLAATSGVAGLAHFQHGDASKTLPFGNGTFDAVSANDVLCHIPGRLNVLHEMFRVLKPGGRMLLATLCRGRNDLPRRNRHASSIGYYVYSPPGENERLIRQARVWQHTHNRYDRERGLHFREVASGAGRAQERTDRDRGGWPTSKDCKRFFPVSTV